LKDELLTRSELSKLPGISLGTLNDWVQEGSLVPLDKRRIGGRGQPQHVYSRRTAEWLRENRQRWRGKERWIDRQDWSDHPHFGWMALDGVGYWRIETYPHTESSTINLGSGPVECWHFYPDRGIEESDVPLMTNDGVVIRPVGTFRPGALYCYSEFWLATFDAQMDALLEISQRLREVSDYAPKSSAGQEAKALFKRVSQAFADARHREDEIALSPVKVSKQAARIFSSAQEAIVDSLNWYFLQNPQTYAERPAQGIFDLLTHAPTFEATQALAEIFGIDPAEHLNPLYDDWKRDDGIGQALRGLARAITSAETLIPNYETVNESWPAIREVWAVLRKQAMKEPHGLAAKIVNAAWQHPSCWTIFALTSKPIREELMNLVNQEVTSITA